MCIGNIGCKFHVPSPKITPSFPSIIFFDNSNTAFFLSSLFLLSSNVAFEILKISVTGLFKQSVATITLPRLFNRDKNS